MPINDIRSNGIKKVLVRFQHVNDYFLDAASELARFESESLDATEEYPLLEEDEAEGDTDDGDETVADILIDEAMGSDDELLSVH